jgi:flagellar hook protein FlgE
VVDRSTGADGVPSEQLYTRDGSFSPDFKGNLKTSTGFYLQGWKLDANENMDVNKLETVNTNQIQGAAAATTKVSMGANLNADATWTDSSHPVGDNYDVTPGAGQANMAEHFDPGATDGFEPTFSRDIQIYDSLGRPRTVTAAFLRTSPLPANEWSVEIIADPADVDTGAHPHGMLAHGTVTFDNEGALDTLSLNQSDTGAALPNNTPTITWKPTSGAADSEIEFDFGSTGQTSGLTQFSSPSDVGFVTQNGAEVGELNGVRIDEEGFVIASFTNGEERRLYKLPVATFPNPSALDPRSGNVYSQTDVAGEFNLRHAGNGGAGTITPSSLEAANVDIADEFSKMIVTQRAYSASSKIISTADQLLEELLRITR